MCVIHFFKFLHLVDTRFSKYIACIDLCFGVIAFSKLEGSHQHAIRLFILRPILYCRYVDDCFVITTTQDEVDVFLH